MTVYELIEILQGLPDKDAEVRVWSADGFGCDVTGASYDPEDQSPHYGGVWIDHDDG